MGETSKRAASREASGWFKKYLSGNGIDIGCGDDPVTSDCRHWDMMDGDAQYLNSQPDDFYDWVYSSHCLEHMVDPRVALENWWRILKPGGHLVVMVPDEDLYEQGVWPPHLNTDHKSTWSAAKAESWSPVHYALRDELLALPGSSLVSVRRYDTGYDYALLGAVEGHFVIPTEVALKVQESQDLQPSFFAEPLRLTGFFAVDQSGSPMNAEVSVEGIARKRVSL